MPSGRMPSGSRPFRRFRSMGYATEFHQNLDAVCITKASDQDPFQQSSRVSSSLSSSLVASNGECPRAILLQPASLVEESNRHQGAVLCCVQRAVHLGPRHGGFLGPDTYASKRSHVLSMQAPS